MRVVGAPARHFPVPPEAMHHLHHKPHAHPAEVEGGSMSLSQQHYVSDVTASAKQQGKTASFFPLDIAEYVEVLGG